MRKINGSEFTSFYEWLINCCADVAAVNYFGSSDDISIFFDQHGKYIGELYADDNALYSVDQSSPEKLHIVDVPWESILSKN